MNLTGGEALVQQLVLEGATHVFGIPGVQLDWAVDALRKSENSIRYMVPRHEQATSYMADGFARTTGKPGVCMVVPGPGILNAAAGLATAYACNARVLCIAGHIQLGCNFFRNDPRRIEVTNKSLAPVLWDRDHAIDPEFLQFPLPLLGQQFSERSHSHSGK